MSQKFFFPLFRRSGRNENSYSTDSLDKRWSSSSEKMSSLTVRILSVNIIAIMILGLGILYLGQYTDSLIEAELQSMESEARFFSGALSEGAVRPVFQISPIPFEDPLEVEAVKPSLARRMLRRLSESATSRVQLYSVDGTMLADTIRMQNRSDHRLVHKNGAIEEVLIERPDTLSIGTLFNQSASRFLDLIPVQTKLPPFPREQITNIFAFPDSKEALAGGISTSAWRMEDGQIILTAAAPVQRARQVLGITVLVRDGAALENKIAEIRVDVFRVFLGSLGITVMLSIYLSGLIGRPLKRLAQAAEAVRIGQSRAAQIPDMSDRGDEIGELSLVLKDMTEALWDRMDTIERFAADVSHEIKNPLTSLRSAVETAAKIKDDEKRKKLMDIIYHDVQRLDRLISDISNASRLDTELRREEMNRFDVISLLINLRDAYKKPIDRAVHQDHHQPVEKSEDNNKITVTKDYTCNSYVLGNEDRLSQVFGNILSNALSFSPPNGTVSITIKNEGAWVVITVSDQGPGIPEGRLNNIFERFYTERPGHESYGDHSGLGLSISKQIIEAHGGEIFASNIKDESGTIQGARFTVKLKAA